MLVAFLAACLLTPLARRFAIHIRFVDSPDAHRKMHGVPVALGGGVAVLMASLVGVGVAAFLPQFDSAAFSEDAWQFCGLAIAAVLLCLVGLVDDRRGIRGRQKLLAQIAAVLVLMAFGIMIHRLTIFGWTFELGMLSAAVTLIWILCAINAMNLVDGADGMASTIGVVVCGTISVMAYLNGYPVDAAVAAALAGALLGFLIFNFPPASIFLGDAGSMFIGLVIGVLAIRSSLKGPATVALAAPVAVMAVPIFDSLVAIVRRRLTGRSIYSTDRGHLHHVLLGRGLSARWLLVWVGVLSGATALGGLVTVYLHNELFAVISALAVVGTLVIGRVFGFAELALLTNHVFAFGDSLVAKKNGRKQLVRERQVRLQGSRNWNEVWETLTDFAEQQGLARVRLSINLPSLHESYHASWEQAEMPDPNQTWNMETPLVANGVLLGRLEFAAPLRTRQSWDIHYLLGELLESISPVLARISAPDQSEIPAPRQWHVVTDWHRPSQQPLDGKAPVGHDGVSSEEQSPVSRKEPVSIP